MSTVIKILLGLAIAYIAVIAIAYMAQRRLTYFPNTSRVPPEQAGLSGVSEETLTTPDGARLIAWYAPAPPGRPTLLYFHGNGGGLANRAMRLQRYQNAGFGILMLSWRGYSGSTGAPSEAANYADARLAYDHLIAKGLKPTDIIIYGESLGTGVATYLANEVSVAGVVLDAPFTSIPDVGAQEYPYFPVRLMMTERYDSASRIARIPVPVLIMHGARDGVVPTAMGQRLYELAKEPKRIMIFPEGRHSDLDAHGAVDVVLEWAAELKR